MPSDLLAAARVFQIPGPAQPPTDDPAPVQLMRPVGSVLPEGTVRPEAGAPTALATDLDHLTGPEGSTTPGTLLAVVPIPGTDSSLAIVGYTVPASAVARDRAQAPRRTDSALVVDHARRCVWLGGQEVQLTYQEFELLAFLSAHPETVFSRADLVRQVWQRDFGADSRTVDVHVSRLRHKLGPAYGRCLVTEYRVGYQFRPQ